MGARKHFKKTFGLISSSRTLSGVRTLAYGTGLESIRAFPSECNEALTHGAARCTHAGMNWSTSAACTDTESSHGIM